MAFDDPISRRRFLGGVAASAASGWVRAGADPAQSPARPKATDELTRLSAVDAVALLNRGELSAVEYARALLEQCEAGRDLNAFITLRPEQVLVAASECDRKHRAGERLGPLHGLPIPIKDSVNTRDLPTTAGTPALRHFPDSIYEQDGARLAKLNQLSCRRDRLHSGGAIALHRVGNPVLRNACQQRDDRSSAPVRWPGDHLSNRLAAHT